MSATPANNGMHPTRDTAAFMYLNLLGGRVMPGVRLLGLGGLTYTQDECFYGGVLMRWLCPRAVVALLTCLLGVGAYMWWAPHSPASEVRQAVTDLQGAALRGDVKFLDRMLADEFVLTTFRGEVTGKPEWLRHIREGGFDPRRETIDDVRISVSGDKATATGTFTNKLELDEAGRVKPPRFIYSYQRRQGRWLLVSMNTYL
jgi:ketosteroid isomerase-like protein